MAVRRTSRPTAPGETTIVIGTRTKFRTWTLWASALLLAADCGCTYDTYEKKADPSLPRDSASSGARGTGPRLIFISNGNSDWWTAVETGMKDGASKFGARAELRRNTEGSPEGQIRLLEDALSLDDVKGVAISVLEAESPGIADKMRDLQKAGKVVIAIDSDGPSDARRAYIGTNNRKAGEVAGKAARTLRPQGGKTVVFVGLAAAANAQERSEGFFAGAGKEFVKLEPFEDKNDMDRALANVETAITKYPDAGVYLGLWSYNAARIAQVVNQFPDLRKRTTVVTFDLDEAAVGHIEQGHIDASVCQNPYEMGYQGVRLLKAFIEDDKATISEMLPGGATTIDTGVRVIVPSKDSPVKGDDVIDIKAMKEWLASKGLKSS
jgi:ribose transport system substrate-binding protein